MSLGQEGWPRDIFLQRYDAEPGEKYSKSCHRGAKSHSRYSIAEKDKSWAAAARRGRGYCEQTNTAAANRRASHLAATTRQQQDFTAAVELNCGIAAENITAAAK